MLPEATKPSAETTEDMKSRQENEDLLWTAPQEDQAIVPVWAFSFNQAVPAINLSKSELSVVLYSSSHLVIVYNINENKQRILRGHVRIVSVSIFA